MIDLTAIDLTPIVQAIIAIISIVIARYLVPWLNAKATIAQREKLANAVETFVFAAEQLYGSGWGQEKLNHVKLKLKEQGYTVDIDLIEATVRKYFGHWGNDDKDDESAKEESAEDEEPQTPMM